MISRFAGQPLKRIAVTVGGRTVRGEAIITRLGLEGGAVYPLAGEVRTGLAGGGEAWLHIDLRPDMTVEDLNIRLSAPRRKRSMATFLRKTVSLAPAAIALLREPGAMPNDPAALAALIKGVRLRTTGCAGLERAISTAGGLAFDAVDEHFMLRARHGVFVAGEMLDWEAPTGGYLLQASLATGVAAARGAANWLTVHPSGAPIPYGG